MFANQPSTTPPFNRRAAMGGQKVHKLVICRQQRWMRRAMMAKEEEGCSSWDVKNVFSSKDIQRRVKQHLFSLCLNACQINKFFSTNCDELVLSQKKEILAIAMKLWVFVANNHILSRKTSHKVKFVAITFIWDSYQILSQIFFS